MPKIGDTTEMENFKLPGNFGFSAAKIDTLGSSEYTLISLAVDDSGSIQGFVSEMVSCIKEIVAACRYSPRADNLMIRLTTFADRLDEKHGFKPLSSINADDYNSVLGHGGGTALYDACVNAIESTAAYGKSLSDQDFSANGIAIFITDGQDNSSAYNPARVKDAIAALMKNEHLESMLTILVAVNMNDQRSAAELQRFQTEAGLTQFINITDANKSSLAKLAAFVSKSISAQSSALGSGGPSQSITF